MTPTIQTIRDQFSLECLSLRLSEGVVSAALWWTPWSPGHETVERIAAAARAGVDLVSVGDTVGTNLWGHPSPLAVTMEEMIVVCKAVCRGVKRAIVSCDIPFGPLQEGIDSALRAAIRLP